MLFLLAMDPLHKLFSYAQKSGLLQKISGNCENFRVSLYTDDAAVFIKPMTQDLAVTTLILKIFADASGLVTNISKTELYPIFLPKYEC